MDGTNTSIKGVKIPDLGKFQEQNQAYFPHSQAILGREFFFFFFGTGV
jgi:hypothetical protein